MKKTIPSTAAKACKRTAPSTAAKAHKRTASSTATKARKATAPLSAAKALKAGASKAFAALTAFALAAGLTPALAIATPPQTPTAEGKDVVAVTPIAGAPTAQQTAEAFAQSPNGRTAIIDNNGDLVTIEDADYTSDDSTRTLGATQNDGIMTLSARPPAFDLRNATFGQETGSFVTPVKFQNPFGSCWAFAAVAAAETSMLTEYGAAVDDPEDALNFSEKHLAWFTWTPYDEAPWNQNGEGFHTNYDMDSGLGNILNMGGDMEYATTLFSALTGPLDESIDELLAYHNAAGEYRPLTDDPNDTRVEPSSEGDWSVPEQYRNQASSELEQSFYLPSPASFESIAGSDRKRYVPNPEGVDAIKDQLLAGRAVAIGVKADHSHPDDPVMEGQYLNTQTWAQYTYEHPLEGASDGQAAHAVCIVGYDDTYSRDNFLPNHQPPADGAFLVKNSWGGKDGTYGNVNDWGIDGTGYFYVSYFDKSLESPEAYDFITPFDDDLTYGTSSGDYEVDSYQLNFLPGMPESTYFEKTTSMANVYEIFEPSVIRTVSIQTYSFNTDVRFDLYRLNDGATEPSDGTLLWSRDEHYVYGGYHRVELEEPLIVDEGDRLGVVVTVALPNGDYELVNNSFHNELYGQLSQMNPLRRTWAVGIINPEESYFGAPTNTAEFSDGSYAFGGYQWNDLTNVIADERAQSLENYEELGIGELLAARDAAYKAFEDISGDDPHYPEVVTNLRRIQADLVNAVSENYGALYDALNDYDNFPILMTAEKYDPDNPPTAQTVELQRVYNPFSGEHLYTTDADEAAALVDAGWNDEGAAWTAPARSNTAVYRAFNPFTGEHLYTSDRNELTALTDDGWNDEGVAFYSDNGHAVPIYRLFNPNDSGLAAHHFTTDGGERDSLVASGWRGEGVAFYGR